MNNLNYVLYQFDFYKQQHKNFKSQVLGNLAKNNEELHRFLEPQYMFGETGLLSKT